jgi:hypothetical protein
MLLDKVFLDFIDVFQRPCRPLIINCASPPEPTFFQETRSAGNFPFIFNGHFFTRLLTEASGMAVEGLFMAAAGAPSAPKQFRSAAPSPGCTLQVLAARAFP